MTDYGAAKLYMLLDRIALALERIADQADGQQREVRKLQPATLQVFI